MTRFLTVAALAVLVSACGSRTHPGAANPLILPPAYGTPSAPVQAAATAAGECNGVALARFAGQAANPASGAEMLRVSGARTMRWVQPGSMITMDFSPQRLTVYLARGNVIERATCG